MARTGTGGIWTAAKKVKNTGRRILSHYLWIFDIDPLKKAYNSG
jgi:hypothetical protein